VVLAGGDGSRVSALTRDVAGESMPKHVATVAPACGTVDVRISGPGATLRLFFDPGDVPPVDGYVVRATVARYMSSLLRSAP
jgi:hypothetical protein